MAKLSLEQLKAVIATYVTENNIAVTDFTTTRQNIVGLIDKIGKIVTLDTTFYDKLPEMDGEELPFGKTVEEYFLDLISPVDYDRDVEGQKALKFYSITHRPVSYSYALDKKIIPLSIPNNDVERAVNNVTEYMTIINTMTKRISDSRAIFKYGVKRELLGTFAKMAADLNDVQNVEDDLYTLAVEDELTEGLTYGYSTSGKVYLCVKDYEIVSADLDTSSKVAPEKLMAKGVLIEVKIVKKVTAPTTAETGEAFIESVLQDVEVASDVSEGYSLNGNTIGAVNGLKLYVKQGIIPALKVKTYAGAFNRDDLAIPAELKVIKDFGSKAPANMYAMLIDYRGAVLHKDYEAVRENFNGYGDFLNLFSHSQYTAFISRNTFITIYINESANA